jgi:hypothetical protein
LGRKSGQNRRSGAVRISEDGGSRRTGLIIGLVAAVLLAGFIALVVWDSRQQSASEPPAGVEDVDVGPGNQHSQGDIAYTRNPPAGGEHNPIWQNCGFYEEPIRSENAVHSLEHGAVWITFRPDLPREQVERLRELAQDHNFVLVSPYPELPSPVVATAWGKQLQLESADDPDLERFVRAYQQGPQTPEPGATCTGGVGEPA